MGPTVCILILGDFRPMGYKLSCCGSLWSRHGFLLVYKDVHGLGKDILFKSILGPCAHLVNIDCERPLM